LANLEDLVIHISRKEMSSFRRICSAVFNILLDFLYLSVSIFLDGSYFLHDSFKEVLHKVLSFFVAVQSSVNFHLDHF
jgi:hypothetical protein